MTVATWLALVVPSLFSVQKYGGWAGVAAYLIWSIVVTRALRALRWPRDAAARPLFLASVAALALLFLAVYPHVNTHLPGHGSDDDDAYDIGVRALLAGQSPYELRTYLGNPLHQLAGAFVVAAPFVLLGGSALQNLFWLPALFVVLGRSGAKPGAMLRLFWLLLLACPAAVHQTLTGTGHLANATYVLAAIWWSVRSPSVLLPAAALGVALASRANFLVLFPLVFGALWRDRGAAVALRAAGVTTAVVLLLTVPFYVADPAQFGPLEAGDRLRRINQWVPEGGEALGVIMVLLSAALACTRRDTAGLFAACAAVQLVPILGVSLIELLAAGRVDLAYAAYALFAMPFMLAATALATVRATEAEKSVSKPQQSLAS